MTKPTKPVLCCLGVHVPHLRTLTGGHEIPFSYNVRCLRCPITWTETLSS